MRELNMFQLIEKQEKLNNLYVPGWRSALTPFHYFVQCIDEAAELFGSGVEYKWWKDVSKDDYDEWNAKIEMVDILFFVASIVSLRTPEHLRPTLNNVKLRNNSGEDYRVIIEGTNKLNHKNVGRLIESILSLTSSAISPAVGTILAVQRIVGSMGFTEEEISAMYMAKYTLNEFRISSDYKSGKYQKVVDGVEDNQRLKSAVEWFMNTPDADLDDLTEQVRKMFFSTVK